MQLQKLLTDLRVAFFLRYKQVIGVSCLVVGLLLTFGVGVQLAFYEKPVDQQNVLGAAITPSPTEQVPIILSTQPTAEITYGPPLPATPTGNLTPTPSTHTNASITLGPTNPSLTPTPSVKLTPTDTITPTPVSTKTVTVVTITPVITLTPEITVTPIPSSPTTVAANTDDAVWDMLAQCESNGHWDDNTGNGYFGGLQFSQGTWESVGGTGSPAQATREEQIMRGKMLQQRRGWGPWGGCSSKLGL